MRTCARSRGGRRARTPGGRAGRRRARPRQRHRQDLHDRDAHRRDARLRGPALHRAVERRERADAGAAAHRSRRTGCAIPKSRCARRKPRRANCDSILDTATDGVVVVDREGLHAHVQPLGRGAVRLRVSRDRAPPVHASCSRRRASAPRATISTALTKNGVASVLNDGREVIGRVRQGGLMPLFMTMGRIGDGMPKFCAVLRDITQWKRAEEDLLNAKRTAERASSAKSDFLAQDLARDPHTAQRHHRLLRGDDDGAVRPDRQRALSRIPQRHPRVRRTSGLADQRPARPLQDRGRQARPRVREREPEPARAAMRRADAAAGEPAAHHHPLLALAHAAAGGGGCALGAADRAQSPVELDQVHRRRAAR